MLFGIYAKEAVLQRIAAIAPNMGLRYITKKISVSVDVLAFVSSVLCISAPLFLLEIPIRVPIGLRLTSVPLHHS